MVSERVRWSVAAGGAFGLVASIISLVAGASVGFTHPFTIAVPVSAALTGGLVWFLVVEPSDNSPIFDGLIAGALTGFLAHIVLFALIALQVRARFSQMVWVIPFSMVFGGVITVPLAILAGVLMGAYRKHYLSLAKRETT